MAASPPTTTRAPLVVKLKVNISDLDRRTAARTPALPFDVGWQPPGLSGIESLVVVGDELSSMIGPRITAATIESSMDSPATCTLTIWDKERALLRSGYLDQKLRFTVAGDEYVLTHTTKNGDELVMSFEDADVNALRQIKGKLKVARGVMTRVEFIRYMLREKGVPAGLGYYIDAGGQGQVTVDENPLNQVAHKARKPGPFVRSTVKGKPSTKEQRDNMVVVLNALFEAGATKDELVMTSMCVTQESSWNNLSGGDRDSVGLFQQRPSQGWKGLTNRKAAALEFWGKLKAAEAALPGQAFYIYIAAVQRPAAQYARLYQQWKAESEKTVSAWNSIYGAGSGPATIKLYEFRRGLMDGTPEDTWEASGRLADEVDYRRFVVEHIFYFLPDDLLIGTGPRLTLSETSVGMLTPIDFDIDEGYEPSTVTFSIHSEGWTVPPGACVELVDCGPADGIWLVNKISGNLFQPGYTDVELVRPRPALTEPPNDETVLISSISGGGRAPATGKAAAAAGEIAGTPKDVIDNVAIPIAAANGVTKTPAQNDIDNHNHTHLGSASDHAGPPTVKWAADFGIGPDIRLGGNPVGALNGDHVAAALAARFGIPWNGAGIESAIHGHYRFQLIWRYESAQAGNHYTHVHFGVEAK